MKRINEILKSLNFPKFYEKTVEEDGSIIYNFDYLTVREYTKEDNKLFLDNLPFTEETIHEGDIELIIQYLEYMIACKQKDEVVSYIYKLMDSMPLGEAEEKSPKLLTILRAPQIKKIGKEIFKVVDEKPYGDFKKKKSTKKVEEVQEKILHPIIDVMDVMETLAGSMLESIEKKNEPKNDEFIFNCTDKGIQIKKAHLEGPEKSKKKQRKEFKKLFKKLIKDAKSSLKSYKKSEFGESKKKIKKNIKRWKKELKKIKK